MLRKGGTFICFYDLWKITELAQMMEAAKFKQHRFWSGSRPIPSPSINRSTT